MSVLANVFKAKCPRCKEGEIFTHGPLNIKKMTSMHQNCPNCNLRYEKEPGNFYGAMYVSYGFSTGIFLVTAFILYYFFNDPAVEVYLIAILVTALVLFPFNFRYSRVVFLYLIWKS
ncbi:DUF983 domain-containing protein [Ekhidna sp.]|uniref:DUF983 domain-containing protein n=1 Tax=Ekhidna sp. TaxID=2608089 RepID=UPI00329910A4